MIADAFSPVNILEQGAQMAKGEQSRMVRPLPSTRVPGRSARAAAHERARAHAHLRLAPTPRPPRATLIPRQSSICGALAVADVQGGATTTVTTVASVNSRQRWGCS